MFGKIYLIIKLMEFTRLSFAEWLDKKQVSQSDTSPICSSHDHYLEK